MMYTEPAEYCSYNGCIRQNLVFEAAGKLFFVGCHSSDICLHIICTRPRTKDVSQDCCRNLAYFLQSVHQCDDRLALKIPIVDNHILQASIGLCCVPVVAFIFVSEDCHFVIIHKNASLTILYLRITMTPSAHRQTVIHVICAGNCSRFIVLSERIELVIWCRSTVVH